MANQPIVSARVTITSKDINGNSVAKTYTNVRQLNLDYDKGMLNLLDGVQGAAYFSLAALTTATYTANTANSPVVHAVVIS